MRVHARLSLLLLALLPLAGAPASADLRREIESAMRSPVLVGAAVTVSVREAHSDAELVEIEGGRPMIPASNMKLLTSGAALHILGPSFRFRTELRRDGDRLIVVGDGDPAFGDPDLLRLMELPDAPGTDVESFLRLWTDAVKEQGVRSVSELVVDDRVFDRELFHPLWPADQLNQHYCAEVAGLSFHLNVLHVFPRPGPARPDISRISPRCWIVPGNQATCASGARDSSNAWIARPPRSNDMTLKGNVKHEYREPIAVALHDPPAFFARLLAERLEAAGVPVASYRLAAEGDGPADGAPVAPAIVTPIGTVLMRCNRESTNLYAEALLKRLAHAVTGEPGSFASGAALVRHALHDRLKSPGLMDGVVVSDGSGLSRANRVTASTMTAWLASFHEDEALGPMLLESLAVAGRDGTLRQRFQDADLGGAVVQAKSGYINGVSCLSGFITAPDGARRAFSILINDLRYSDIRAAKELQERIVAHIARDMAAGVTLGGG